MFHSCPTDDHGYPLDPRCCPECEARSQTINAAFYARLFGQKPIPAEPGEAEDRRDGLWPEG